MDTFDRIWQLLYITWNLTQLYPQKVYFRQLAGFPLVNLWWSHVGIEIPYSALFPLTISHPNPISNHTVFLVQFRINLHLRVFQKAEIALAEAAPAITAFWKTHLCKLIPNWTWNRMITYTNTSRVISARALKNGGFFFTAGPRHRCKSPFSRKRVWWPIIFFCCFELSNKFLYVK